MLDLFLPIPGALLSGWLLVFGWIHSSGLRGEARRIRDNAGLISLALVPVPYWLMRVVLHLVNQNSPFFPGPEAFLIFLQCCLAFLVFGPPVAGIVLALRLTPGIKSNLCLVWGFLVPISMMAELSRVL